MNDDNGMPDLGVDEADLTPDERANLAVQLARLNDNLETQFEIIASLQLAESKASKRRWRIVMAVVLLIVLGNVRVEQVRRESYRRDKDAAAAANKRERADEAAAKLAQCRRTNLSRSEIRSAFDQQGEALLLTVQGADPKTVAAATALVEQTHEALAASLKSTPCSDDPPATYETCAEAIADGQAPLRRGQPGYRPELDADGDGTACE